MSNEKTALVTGAAGFIGSHLCEQLVRDGVKVRAFVHYNSRNHWGWLEDSPQAGALEIVSGDLRDFDSVSRATRGMDTIYHLGALIGIPYSYESPLAYIRTNVEGTYNILEAARTHGARKTVVTSTSEVYGTAMQVPIPESHPLQPQSPYSASKIAADNLALSYFHSFSTPVVVARPFNTFGPRQSARAIIPTIVTQLLNDPSSLKLGNLDPTRDLTFVSDTVQGIAAIARTEEFIGKAVNIGTGDASSVGQLVEKISEILGVRPKIELDEKRVRPCSSEVMRLISDNGLLRSRTAWAPQVSLEQGLRQTVEWIKGNRGQYKAGIYNV